jgi:hypothetical protein
VAARLDPSLRVVANPPTRAVHHLADIFVRPDGTIGSEELRRDPEDLGHLDAGCEVLEGVTPDQGRLA